MRGFLVPINKKFSFLKIKKFYSLKMYLILTIIFLFISNIFPQQNGPDSISTLVAISRLNTISEGAIQLSWIYPGPNSLPENSKYYIQYSTFPEVSWSTSVAQVVFSTGPVYPL
jgi:hypothetical protein